MAESFKRRLEGIRIYVLVMAVFLTAAHLLVTLDWQFPTASSSRFWNGLVAFALLGIACDSSFLRISRIPFANVSSSVVFIPLLASVPLFGHPWPMLISGLTAAVVDSLIHRKRAIRVWFNTSQYMLAIGLGGLVYTTLGGPVSVERFSLALVPFVGLVGTFIVVNTGSVALAVSFSSGVSVRESWDRIVGRALVYDLFSSSLALLLVFLYVEFQIAGLAVLILPLFFVRHIYQMNLQVEQVNRELLELMVKAIEARDPYTSGHSVRVAEYARSMARELGLSAKQVDNIATAGLLHDVGKIYEEFAALLRKDGRLTPEERMTMQSHPVRSAELVGTIAGFRGVVQEAIRHHHENFDGTGYPDGLVGDHIPIGARIIMIADTIDAMTTDRPYRGALTLTRALEELAKYSGRQFDPGLVRLVSKSPSIRRLLGPEPVVSAEVTPVASMQGMSSSWGARVAH